MPFPEPKLEPMARGLVMVELPMPSATKAELLSGEAATYLASYNRQTLEGEIERMRNMPPEQMDQAYRQAVLDQLLAAQKLLLGSLEK